MRKFGLIKTKAHCSVLDAAVVVVQARDDQRLDQEFRCIVYEDRPDPADRANLQDRAIAVMLGVQDSLPPRITPGSSQTTKAIL